jgi:hypothetical protein
MTTAAALKIAVAAPDPVEAFELRCWARARLYRDGELGLHDAVDELQAAAVAGGLVERIGQDAVQAVMSSAFAVVRDDLRPTPPLETTCSVQATCRRTPETTIEATMWCLREGGLSCLSERKNRDRLASCDAAAMKVIARRLLKLGWSPGDVGKLIEVRDLAEEDCAWT